MTPGNTFGDGMSTDRALRR
uniref:Uncharacterized protein n=1 Tax=Steinernema glaseri TaxID=37863 RepID=A0A1I7Y3X4_9BILA